MTTMTATTKTPPTASSPASGKLTVDELISLRAVGVTPEYINTMRALFPDLTVHQVSGLRAVGVTPEFVRDMRSAGHAGHQSRTTPPASPRSA
jgi:hypothetical protein